MAGSSPTFYQAESHKQNEWVIDASRVNARDLTYSFTREWRPLR